MKPSGKFIRVASCFQANGKVVKNRIYGSMPSIAVPGSTGTIVPLEVVPATDGSGTYVWVVALQNPEIDVGTVNVALTYNLNPPVLNDGEMTGFQGDIHGNLKVNITQPLPAGSHTIGSVDQGAAGSAAWKVDPSGVTSPVAVESLPPLPAGSNTIGSVLANAGTNLNTSALALESGGNLETLSGAVVDGRVQVALPAGDNIIGGTLPSPTSSSSFAITPAASSALEAGHVLKAGPGNLYSLYVMTTSVAGFLMTFNATSIPADGAVRPVECIQISAESAAAISFDGAPPDYYSTGIVAVFSSTGPFAKTASATAFFKWRVE
jgi:hypothetical protein